MNRNIETELETLHRELGLKRLRGWWAKAEIFGGLLMVALGLAVIILFPKEIIAAAGIVLFVLGGYLAMAGHRSHLYQSNNMLAAWLSCRLREEKSSKELS